MRTTALAICLLATSICAVTTAHAVTGPGLLTVTTAVPADATAVLANLTMVNGSTAGYVTADRCDDLTDAPQPRSSGNHGVGAAVANLAVVPVSGGQFCTYHQRSVDLIADVQGYVGPPSTDGLRFTPSSPVRVLDTRGTGPTAAALPAGDTIVRVQTEAPAGAEAVLTNITMVGATTAGYVTADLCSRLIAGPQTRSNGNHLIGNAVSNVGVVPVDADGAFCIYRQRAVHLAVDVQGSFARGTNGLGVHIAAPERVLDTRESAPVAVGDSIVRVETGAAAGTDAALVNITMVDGVGTGYVTADRCSELTAGPQQFSNGNHVGAAAVSNLAIVPVEADGSFCIYRQRPVQLTVDVQRTFAASATEQLHLVPPSRVLDTRPPPSALPTTSCDGVVHIGDSTSVGLISSTILPDPADRVDAQYRRVGVDDPRMEISGARSIVERLPGQATAFEVAQAQVARGYHGCWVFALGTTDTANVAAGSSVSRRARIDMMMQLVGNDPVMWVNLRTLETADPWSNAQMQAWNRELDAATLRYSNLKIYDWASVAEVAWFSSDRIHYTPEGYRQRAHLIADALAVLYPA